MAAYGDRSRKERSLSSASATKTSPWPACALLPDSLSVPPIAKDGSTPQACTATVSIEVVEVLPCVPATATLRRPAITAARATARGSTRSPRSRAARSSGLSSRMAVDTTTVSASPTFPPSWPSSTRAPSWRSASRVGLSRRSLPETRTPRASRMRAIPLMPARSEEHTSELQSRQYLVCRLLLEKKKKQKNISTIQSIQSNNIKLYDDNFAFIRTTFSVPSIYLIHTLY